MVLQFLIICAGNQYFVDYNLTAGHNYKACLI